MCRNRISAKDFCPPSFLLLDSKITTVIKFLERARLLSQTMINVAQHRQPTLCSTNLNPSLPQGLMEMMARKPTILETNARFGLNIIT